MIKILDYLNNELPFKIGRIVWFIKKDGSKFNELTLSLYLAKEKNRQFIGLEYKDLCNRFDVGMNDQVKYKEEYYKVLKALILDKYAKGTYKR